MSVPVILTGGPGGNLVDLTLTEETPKHLTGDKGDYTVPADPPHSDGKGGWLDQNNKPVDQNGDPLPTAEQLLQEVLYKVFGIIPPDPPAPHMGAFTVNPASFYIAESTILKEAKTQIDEFEKFKQELIDQESWVFFTGKADDVVPRWVPQTGVFGKDRAPEPAHWEVTKDPDANRTAEIVGGQNALIQGVGSSIHLIGTFSGTLNDAGQMYVAADRASWVPEQT